MFALQLQKEDLERLKDPETVLLLFKEALSLQSSLSLWDYHNSLQSLQLKEVSSPLFSVTPMGQASSWLSQLLITPSYLFNLNLPRASFFFKTNYQESRSEPLPALWFQMPLEVFKVQRRKNVRLQIPENLSLWATFSMDRLPTVSFKRRLLDLSATGCSFLIDWDQGGQYYSPGERLQHFSFQIQGKIFRCEAEVKHAERLSPTPPARGRVGVAFLKLSEADQHAINLFVFQEMRRYYSKFVE